MLSGAKFEILIFIAIFLTSIGMFFLKDSNEKRKDNMNIMILMNCILAYAVLAHPVIFNKNEEFNLANSFRDFILMNVSIVCQFGFIVSKIVIASNYKK